MNAHDMAQTTRTDLAGFVGDIERLETIFASWDGTQQAAVGAYRLAIEQLNGEALRRLIRALKTDPAALAAMKNALADEIVYAVLRHHGIEADESIGRPFDPHYHEAVSVRHDPSQPDHIILDTFQRGYRRGNEVFRPAKVVVNDLSHAEAGRPAD